MSTGATMTHQILSSAAKVEEEEEEGVRVSKPAALVLLWSVAFTVALLFHACA